MGHFYRLATARLKDKQAVFVESDDRFFPLADLLTPEDRARLNSQAPDDLLPLMQDWDYWREVLPRRIETHLGAGKHEAVKSSELTFCAPMALPNKLICIGANYHDHIKEMPIPMEPTYPFSFLKPPSTTLRGSGIPVEVPSIAEMIDWEAELAVIIGRPCRNVTKKDAFDYVAGYANLNDISARDWLANRPGVGVDWVRHKGFDGFAPMGPFFVSAEFIADPQDLSIELTVNGVVKQSSNTGQMVFGVAEIIEHLSGIMTLEPGDVIATGTPAGVGNGRKPPEYLKAGDVIRMEVGPLGVLETPMV